MKGKLKNTFKFKNFSERINEINIDVFHSTVNTHAVPENDKDTFFREALEKWSELNCSLDFTALYNEVKKYVQSFNQLLFHKEIIVNILKRYLSKIGSLALEPCLDLLAQLSRDLLQEFYPYFADFLELLFPHLKGQDTSLIENTFTCLAHIFKFGWRFIIKDLHNAFRIFKPLLMNNQKRHIKVFAAESFAFLIRKSKTKADVVHYLFTQLKGEENIAEGLGFLLFHSIKGVKHQFTFNAPEMLQHTCQIFKDHTDKVQGVLVLKNLWMCSLQHCTVEYSSVLFTTLYDLIENEVLDQETFDCMITILDMCIQYKNGKLVPDAEKLCKMMLELATSERGKMIGHFLKSLLTSSNLQISPTIYKELCDSFLFNENVEVATKLKFSHTLFSWTYFDDLVKPSILKMLSMHLSTLSTVEEIAHYKILVCTFIVDMTCQDEQILIKPFSIGSEVMKLNFPSENQNEKLVADLILDDLESRKWESEAHLIWVAVVCLGNIRLNVLQERKTIRSLSKMIGHYFLLGLEDRTNQNLFVFSHCIKAYLSIQNDESDISNDVAVENMVEMLRSHPANHNVLQCFEAFSGRLLKNCKSSINIELKDIHNIVKENMHSPYAMIRLLSVMILNHFEEVDSKQNELFQLCINTETVSATLDSYRERLMHLRKLNYDACKDLPLIYGDTALRFLIGNLFINLNVIWDPVIELITSYACDENHENFWNIWKDVVVASSAKCESNTVECSLEMESGCNVFNKYFNVLQTSRTNTRIDFCNFRILVWKAMTHFADLAERKSRDIVPLFFKFFMNEYSPQEELMARKQDIRVKSSRNIIEKDKVSDETSIQKIDRKIKIKTLCTVLKLFSSFKNPRALSKEKELLQLYYELLTNKDNEVQNLSLTCLHSYKFPFMKPYVENFDKLMNDGTFRDELTCFASDSTILKEEHREDVMPILIRLLYGKLQRKAGLGISGKSSLAVRRNIVMQFLANCSDKEIKTFFDLILQPFVVKGNLDVSFNLTALDVSCIIPIRRQSGFLNMLSTVIAKLMKRIKPFQVDLFLILLKIIWTCSICLREKQQEIDMSHIGRLKDLRHLGVIKLVEFFEVMTAFDYQHYIEEIFTAVVCPQLDIIMDDAVQNVTPLLRLFLTWSKHSRYQPLLSKMTSNGTTPLHCVYKLLDKTSLSNNVEKELMLMSLHLLTSEDFVEEGCKNGRIIETFDRSNRLEKVGIIIIKPYVLLLINYLSTKLLSKLKKLNMEKKQKIGQIIPDVQLSVLSHISEFVTDKVQCDVLLKILFPLLQCIAAEETQLHVLTTIKHLLPLQESHDEYLPGLPSLFSTFNSRKTRQVLCDVYLQMTKDSPNLYLIASLLIQLNSWDKKRLDEPDYDQRLEAYREIAEHLKTNSLDINQVLPLLHDCLHVVMTTDDMSLRDAASSCLQKIIQFVKQNEADTFHMAISKRIFPAVKTGLKLKKETARNEFIELLAFMVRTFDCEAFNDMKVLISSDAEADFFNNIKHIQVHRRIRALQLLSNVCKDKQITIAHMFSLFLPMINHVIFDDLAATKDHNLLSETIATIGTILNCLPWSKYLHILSSYLKLMKKGHRNLKTIIRVVISILDGFHFDVSLENLPCVQNQDLSVEDNTTPIDDEDKHDDDDDVVPKDKDVASAQRILNTLSTRILPQIKSFLNKKSGVVHFHKLSNNKQEDDEEIMKVPMALAMVKLLQHLPKSTLHTHLPGLLLRVSQSLRSHARDVRDVARDTLKKICLSLGASYFHMVLKEMRSVLLRGYQLHVLGYTVHSLLDALKDMLQSGDMDNCVDDLMQIVKEELYGVVSEEKDISGITGKLMEAKSHKSNDSLEIFSMFITAGCITRLLRPLKEILDSTTSHKTGRKVEESLRRISLGLQTNKGLPIDDLLLFVHGVVSSTLPMMGGAEKNQKKSKEHKKEQYVREDIYIVPSLPSRGGKMPLASKMTNDHILMEFGLQLLHTCLKRQRLTPTDDTHIRMLDPFVGVLLLNITSKYSKVIVLTMRCLSFLVKFPLPSIKDSVPLLAKHLFKILKRYAKAGAGQGENFELVMTSFKTMTVMIRDYKDFAVNNKQLRLLLAFVEEDVYNSARQATALPLLKAILSRKLMVTEVHEIMKKISDLSVRDSDETTRLQCRQLMSQYLLDYPLGKKLSSHLDFFITHLSYDEEVGRLSSLEMIKMIIKNFPERLVQDHSGYFFIPLVMLLGNDESSKCRKLAADVIKLLLKSLDSKTRSELFDITLTWSHQEKVLVCQVAMQAFGMFVEVEEKQFEKKVESLFPVLQQVLKDAYLYDESDDVSAGSDDETEGKDNSQSAEINAKDKLLYNTLTCFGKLLLIPRLLLRNEKYDKLLADVWKYVHGFLLHPHVWIRLASSQLFSLYFGAITPEEIAHISETSSQEYLLVETVKKIKELTSSFFLQMKDENLTSSVAEQATKNLIYLTKVVKLIDPYLNENTEDLDEEEQSITVKSFVIRMNQLASFEASHTPKQTLKRTCAFRWIGALCLNMDEKQMKIYLPNLLRPLHREISSETESELRTLAQEVLELIRTTYSKDGFAEAYAKLQMKVADVRESRKRKAASEAVADPVKHALRKQKNNLSKRQQRKRKLYEKKPTLKFKKIRSQSEV